MKVGSLEDPGMKLGSLEDHWNESRLLRGSLE